MIYTYSFKPGMDDINPDYSVKNTAILRMLENAAGFHSDTIGNGILTIEETRKAWALLDWEYEIISPLTYGMELTVKTWSRGYVRTFAYRDYEIYNGDTLCLKATSKWFIIDIDRRFPVRLTEDIMTPYQSEPHHVFDNEEIEKLFEQDNYEDAGTYTTRRSDEDIVGHVHNVNYIQMINEYLSPEEMTSIKHVHISYKKEIMAGETVLIKKQHLPDGKYCFSINSMDGKDIHSLCEMY